MGIAEVLGAHRDRIIEITARHHAGQVRVFGSLARGEARPDSDIDLLVSFDREVSLFDHVRLALELEGALGRPVDLATEADLRPAHRDRVVREAVLL